MGIKPGQLNSSPVQSHADPGGPLTFPNTGRANGSDLASSLEATSEATFMAVARGYSRDDLQNPGRADALVKSAAEHLARQHLAHLPVDNQQAFSRWIQIDPLLRQQILSYFEARL